MAVTIQDRFEEYYSEKLWELIPAIYRQEDGLVDPKDVLRGLIEIFAEQAAILRRSQDRLWDDEFIELCDDWAVPYIAGLLATRLVSAKNLRGRRIDVAKTIYNRKRKGTPRILEELIYDISGWKGKLVESFQRLARTRHGLDPKPLHYAGRFTGTMPGGVADLRSASGSELASGPFDEFFHTPDFRRPHGKNGLYGITKLNFHLYRLVSYEAVDVDPFRIGQENPPDTIDDGQYTFDPSGRMIPLFVKDGTPQLTHWENWHSAYEWELPLPIRCRLLSQVEFRIREQFILDITNNINTRKALRKLIGIRFLSESAFDQRISGFGLNKEKFMHDCIINLCGKNQLWPGSLCVKTDPGFSIIPKEKMAAANYANNNTNPAKDLIVDAENGRFWFTDKHYRENILVNYNYGFAGPCGAGFYDRDLSTSKPPNKTAVNRKISFGSVSDGDVAAIKDSLTYTVETDITDIKDFTLQAANHQRPYIQLEDDWLFTTGANKDSRLVLDGLWIGSVAGSTLFKVILKGDYECIVIRNCTFDPGGTKNANGDTIQPVQLVFDGTVEQLCIENCILGPLRIKGASIVDESCCISDSIIQSVDPALPAIEITTGLTNLQRSTILGELSVHRLYASDSMITGIATVTDNQAGCFRFSAAPSLSILPGPYESYLFDTALPNNYWFTSHVFGQPGYGQLNIVAPMPLYTGAENGAEMGAFNRLINAIRFDGLTTKTEEYMPFGLIPAFVYET